MNRKRWVWAGVAAAVMACGVARGKEAGPTHTLLVAGQPSREYLFLVPVLLRDPCIRASVYLQAAEPGYVQQGNADIRRLPSSKEEWAGLDAVILLDADPKGFSAEQMADLAEAVRRGINLVFVPGRWHPLAQWAKTHPKPMAALCPVELPRADEGARTAPAVTAYRLARTGDGARHPVLRAADGKANEAVWSQLDTVPFYDRPTVRHVARADARTLVWEQRGESQKVAPWMVAGRHGKGRTLFIATPDTWRWRRFAGDWDYAGLWRRILSAGETVHAGPVWLAEKRGRGATYPGRQPVFLVTPRGRERTDMARALTPELRATTQKALAWLVKRQEKSGGWTEKEFGLNTGVTALCCLALMAEGNAPRVGPHGDALDRGLAFLLNSVQHSGVISSRGSNRLGPAYEHAFSLVAVCLAPGEMAHRPGVRTVIRRAVGAIEKTQRKDGGWRYQMARGAGGSDTSVTSVALLALDSAAKAGFKIDGDVTKRAVRFLERCCLPDGTVRYRQSGLHASPGIQAAVARAFGRRGHLDHPLIAPARDQVAYHCRRYPAADLVKERYVAYNTFHMARLLYTCGDKYWGPWFKKCVEVYTAMQRKDGSFADKAGNTVYPTACAAIVLQAPLGCLPLFER